MNGSGSEEGWEPEQTATLTHPRNIFSTEKYWINVRRKGLRDKCLSKTSVAVLLLSPHNDTPHLMKPHNKG